MGCAPRGSLDVRGMDSNGSQESGWGPQMGRGSTEQHEAVYYNRGNRTSVLHGTTEVCDPTRGQQPGVATCN